MADPVTKTERDIVRHIAQDTGDADLVEVNEQEVQPVYKMVGDSARPVSKHMGGLWKSRVQASGSKLEKSGKLSNWAETIRYYKNDQRAGRGDVPAARTRSVRINENGGGESENIVFANTSALVPAIYAKNPSAEVTSNYRDDNQEGGRDSELEALSTVGERLINTLSSQKASPGINLKPKARKAVVMTTLTNISYLEVGYTKRENSTEQALRDLDNAAAKLANAKDSKEIEEAEGQLIALEEKIDFLRPSGPWVKFRHPKDFRRDTDATESDLSDSKWCAVADYVSTAYINAVFRQKSGNADEWTSIYKPTHVLGISRGEAIQDEINSFSLLKENSDYKTYGYNDEETFNKAQRTKVWYVWDKITRRVYMFNDEDWSWPIWVWDDPFNLDTFFPFYPLEFYTDPEDDIGNSEVMYYLDQQDAINENNAEKRKIRKRIMGSIFYNSNVVKDKSAIEAYVNGTDNRTAVGINAPTDTDMSKAFFALLPPSAQFLPLLDNAPYKEAANAVSSVMPVLQGQQFKTNTTNDAIETYNSAQQTRLDEKIDAVEDTIGNILWGVLQLCLQFMSKEEVAIVIGDTDAAIWRNFEADEIRKNFSVRVVGGSSQKPTSRAKKQEAIQMGQVLGQFGNAGGGAVVLLILKVFERAFDELVITKNDWQYLQALIMQGVANSNPTGNPGASGQAESQVPPGATQGTQPDAMMQLAELVNQLPPEAKAALGTALERGVPIEEALPRIIELVQQATAGVPQ
jgi:hypothetical protein